MTSDDAIIRARDAEIERLRAWINRMERERIPVDLLAEVEAVEGQCCGVSGFVVVPGCNCPAHRLTNARAEKIANADGMSIYSDGSALMRVRKGLDAIAVRHSAGGSETKK